MLFLVIILRLVAQLLAVYSTVGADTPTESCFTFFTRVEVEIGANIGEHVEQRIIGYLRSVEGVQVGVLSSRTEALNALLRTRLAEEVTLVLSLGNASLANEKIPKELLSSMEPESFHLSFDRSHHKENVYIMVSNGLPLDPATHRNISFSKDRVHYGAIVGAYAALEELGFAFLHPLEPHIPSQLRIYNPQCSSGRNNSGTENFWSGAFKRTESPHWPERGFHIHTQHPLELVEVLQGHDIPQFGPHGPACKQHAKQKPLDAHRHPHKAHPASGAASTTPTTMSATSTASSIHQTATKPAATTGTAADKTTPYCERWEDMVTDVDYFFEWAVANRLNKVEWLLLGNYKWGDEWVSRRNRLRVLTDLGHQYSLMIGADVPLGNVQQHGWYIVNVRLPFAQQAQQIRERVDWVLSTGFDFLTTESGLSEFTHPECDHMVELMNIFAEHVNVTWGREAAIKVHCSTGQRCDNYQDPRTGEPINFNFLPTYAHPGMGVFPHTVQIYALDDPTAFAYGNENFSYVEDYLVYEAKLRNRSVTFYGETAYWVNVDIDVPLFLPLYGQRRQHDLRRLALREVREGFRMDGQMNFDSGWEWGYWLSAVVTARASWQPYLRVGDGNGNAEGMNGGEGDDVGGTNRSHSSAEVVAEGICEVPDRNSKGVCSTFNEYTKDNKGNQFSSSYEARQDQWEAFALALRPYSALYGPEFGPRLTVLIVELAQAQAEVLIHGRVNGTESADLRKLTGIAYLSGGDTWVDIPRMFGLSFTQPDKVHMKESHDPLWGHVLALQQEMVTVFGRLARRMDRLHSEVQAYSTAPSSAAADRRSTFIINNAAMKLLSEIKDGMTMLALRAEQVQLLYQSRDPVIGADAGHRKELLRQARAVVHQAEEVVKRREAEYRVPWQRVAEWRENPTVYRFGYLWAVHSLFYWWRDQGLAEQGSFQSEHSPCYLNRMDPTEVAVGWGKYTLEVLRAFINRYTPFSAGSPLEVVNCLSPPARGYEFPKDLYRF